MWRHYRLQPRLAGEPDPVILAVHTTEDSIARLALSLYVIGARTLGPRIGLSPDGIRQVMDAGTSYNRWEGVRLSNGFNVIDPPDWRRQGIGTVAMNQMIEWAKRRHTDAEVRPVELKRRGEEIAQSDPRIAFYRRFRLEWRDDDQDHNAADWRSAPLRVSDLEPSPMPSNITRL